MDSTAEHNQSIMDSDHPPTLFPEDVPEEANGGIISESAAALSSFMMSPRQIVTKWKGVIVPMNDHSDKEAVLYRDPNTDLSYRFILHRRNNQKADNYACARCKSRKKYVRILIAGDYFMEDPAGLEHICYMNQDELREARERSQEKKSRSMLKERQILAKRTRNRHRGSCGVGQEQEMSIEHLGLLANLHNETPVFPVATIARLFEDPSSVPIYEHKYEPNHSDVHDSPTYSTGDDEEMNNDIEASGNRSLLNLFRGSQTAMDIKPSVRMNPVPMEDEEEPEQKISRRDEAMKSDADPDTQDYNSKSKTVTDDDVFGISLQRALDGLKPEFRTKAENEVLRFIYSNLYEKYA